MTPIDIDQLGLQVTTNVVNALGRKHEIASLEDNLNPALVPRTRNESKLADVNPALIVLSISVTTFSLILLLAGIYYH